MISFSYTKVKTVDEAVEKISKAEDGLFLAGGQTLLPIIKQGLAMPSDIITLDALHELKSLEHRGDKISIGAMTSHAEVANSSVVRDNIPALAYLAGQIGDPHVRNLGTIGGSIANNDPAADYPAAVLGLGATIRTNRRSISSDDFFIGLFETALDESELVIEVEFPIPEKAGYAKFLNPASRYAIVGVFVSVVSERVRVSVTGAASCVFRQSDFEHVLLSKFENPDFGQIPISTDDLNSDIFASAVYRAHLIKVMAARAVAAANKGNL